MTIKETTSKRSVWMAFGILWVVLFHTDLLFNIQILNDIKLYGYGGVDILLFASGLGCYYSFKKDENITAFLARRVKRLFPLYFCFILITQFSTLLHSKPDKILRYLFSSDFSWFMKGIWILYLLVPLFYAFIKKNDSVLGKTLLIAIVMIVSCAFWDDYPQMVFLCRIPVFILGMIVGWLSASEDTSNKKIPIIAYIIIYILMALGFAWLKLYYVYTDDITHRIALKWWPFLLISPGICLILSFIALQFDKIKIGKIVNACANIIGKSTFEIFLWHIFWAPKVNRYAWMGEHKKWIPWTLELAGICAATVLIEKLVKFLSNKSKVQTKGKDSIIH